MNIPRCALIRCVASILLSMGANPTWAATLTWINTSGGDWNIAGNWSPSGVPGATDTALITAAGTYVVNVSDSESAASLTIGGATGTQSLQINSGGALNEAGGTMTTKASLTVAGGGTLNASSGFDLYGPLTNNGTINMTNADFYLFNNNTASLAGGIVNNGEINFYGASGDGMFSEGYGYEYLINHGTISEEAGAGPSLIYGMLGALAGTYNAALGTTTQFTGGGTAANPSIVGTLPVLNGPGQYEFTGGYLLLTENAIPNLRLVGGTLELGPAFQQGGAITNLTLDGTTLPGTNQVSGTLTVTNSAIPGALTVNSGGVLNEFGVTVNATGWLTVEGGGSLNVFSGSDLYGPITNNGTINMTNADFYLFNNNTPSLAGGIVNNGEINFYGASGDGIISEGYGYEYLINQGTINEEAGVGPSLIYGMLGALAGTYNAALGTTIQFTGGGTAVNPLTVGTPPVLNGPGQYQFTGGYLLLTENAIPNLRLVGGTLELGPAFQQGGAITNLTLDGTTLAGTNNVNGTLTATNSAIPGALTVNSGGVLNAFGVTVNATGWVTIGGGGSFNAFSGSDLYGPITNNGTINMTNAGFYLFNNNTASLAGGIANNGQINFYGASGDFISSEGYGFEYLINQGAISQRPGTGGSSINPAIFTDPGTLDLQEGTLSLNTVSLQSSSVLNFGLNSLTDFGSIILAKSVVLNGTVSANLNNGFAPATGAMFKVLSYPAFSGIFAGTNPPPGYLVGGIYGSTSFNLLITGTGTAPSQPVLTIERAGATTVDVSWPTAAGNFNLQTSTALPAENWSDVTSGITTIGANYVLTATISGKGAFFRLQSQ